MVAMLVQVAVAWVLLVVMLTHLHKEVAQVVMDAPHYLNHIHEICSAARLNC